MTTPRPTKCRHCGALLTRVFADLGAMPAANDFLNEENRSSGEMCYPLRAFVCDSCRLVQLEDFRKSTDLFREDYAYFSSVSTTWLAHAKRYAADMQARFGLDRESRVVEVASNDGYLLQYFAQMGLDVLGVEPCASVADHAIREKRIPTEIAFFGEELAARLASEGYAADLAIANNVLAHVPDINDFVAGFREILKPEGVATFEFPHLLNLIRLNQFDTIYHEHFSYISLLAAERFFATNGMRIFDADELATHGGSLRLYTCRAEAAHARRAEVDAILHKECEAGLDADPVYVSFGERVHRTKRNLLKLLIELKEQGKVIVGYGAPAKGNTLLNYCGVGADFLEFTVDRSANKQGLFLPGTRLPIKPPEAISALRPDYVLVLPWNIKEEIMEQMACVRDWGGRFIVPIPTVQIV